MRAPCADSSPARIRVVRPGGAERDRSAPVVRGEQRGQLRGADLRSEPLDEPPRVRPLDGEPVHRVRSLLGKREAFAPEACRAPQHRVHQAASPAGEPHAGVDGGVRRNPIEEEELVQPHAQRGPNRRIERGDRPVHQLREMTIEPALPGERAVDQLGGEGAVLDRERRAGEAACQQHVRVRRRGLDADEHVLGDAAGIPGGHPNRVPGGSGWPARNARAAMRFLPSSCTSTRRRAPSPVATSMPAPPAASTLPGDP